MTISLHTSAFHIQNVYWFRSGYSPASAHSVFP